MATHDDGKAPASGASVQTDAETSGAGIAGPPVLPGAVVVRHAHGLRVEFHIDQLLARVSAELRLGAAEMKSLELTHATPVVPFNIVDGDATATGSLMVRFAGPPRRSAVQGDFEIVRGDDVTPFRGDLVVWESPATLILNRFSTFVAPMLEVRVDLGDSTVEQISRDPTLARVQLLYVSQVIYQEIVSSTKIRLQLPAIKVGAIEIDDAARILYRPATVRQTGQVTLTLSGRDAYGSEFQWDGAVATWENAMVRQRGDDAMPDEFEAEPLKLISLAESLPFGDTSGSGGASPGQDASKGGGTSETGQ